MKISDAYLPQQIFLAPADAQQPPPRVFIAPQRYVQGAGVLDGVGRYLALVDARRVAILITRRGERSEGPRLHASLQQHGIDAVVSTFAGECSLEEIDSHVAALRDRSIDCIVAVGGGKCVDTGKGIAFRLNVPVVVVPSLASNDAPCSALSVLYTPEGVSTGAEFYPQSPALVIVDTAAIAAAPARYLVAGMGDAMATWYEANVCLNNPRGVTTVGARPTLAAAAIGETCAQTLFNAGVDAAAAVARHEVTGALEQVVEANTLLSGLGFESGGLAAAHAFAQAYTGVPHVEANYLHGEMVAMGTLAQLAIEQREDEAHRVAEFFADVGLPVHLGQLSLTPGDTAHLDTIADGALTFPFIGNMPMRVDHAIARQAILTADSLGRAVTERKGDAAYRALHAA
jgi:glycerol dehydrogenase